MLCLGKFKIIYSFIYELTDPKNLYRWEKSNKAAIFRSKMITLAINSNLHQISSLLTKTYDFDLANDIVKMLDLFSAPEQNNFLPNVELTLKLTRAVIQYFFLCIAEEGMWIVGNIQP